MANITIQASGNAKVTVQQNQSPEPSWLVRLIRRLFEAVAGRWIRR
jgi:hypothetical protein